MSQGSLVVPLTGPNSFGGSTGVAAQIEAALLALATLNSGASAPANGPGSVPVTFQFWLNTTANPYVLNIYDGANWVQVGLLDTGFHTFRPNSQAGFRNRLLNGNMRIAQRGASFSSAASGSLTLDRWIVNWTGAAPASVTQIAWAWGGGHKYCAQISGAASNTQTAFIERMEAAGVADLVGQSVTISAMMVATSAQTVLWKLYYPNTEDTFGSYNLISSGTWSATTSGQAFQATISSLPAGAANGLELQILPQNGGAFTSGSLAITGVQLESGPQATPFERRPLAVEVFLCEKFFEKSYDLDVAPGSVTLSGCVAHVVEATASFPTLQVFFRSRKRAPGPTLVVYSPTTGASAQIRDSGVADVAASFFTGGTTAGCISVSGVSIAAGHTLQAHWTASSEL